VLSRELQGDLQGQGLRISVVVARFNELITSKLLEGAESGLARYGVASDDVTVVRVPGSFEIPVAAKGLAETGTYNAVICLGAVIRGETDHYEHIGGAAARGIANVSLSTGVPVIFGVLTTDTVEQAMDRAGGKQGNSGYNAALAAIEMANLLRALAAD
jgi:6,7-dimethyl-8-ribityllumazine synthase